MQPAERRFLDIVRISSERIMEHHFCRKKALTVNRQKCYSNTKRRANSNKKINDIPVIIRLQVEKKTFCNKLFLCDVRLTKDSSCLAELIGIVAYKMKKNDTNNV